MWGPKIDPVGVPKLSGSVFAVVAEKQCVGIALGPSRTDSRHDHVPLADERGAVPLCFNRHFASIVDRGAWFAQPLAQPPLLLGIAGTVEGKQNTPVTVGHGGGYIYIYMYNRSSISRPQAPAVGVRCKHVSKSSLNSIVLLSSFRIAIQIVCRRV